MNFWTLALSQECSFITFGNIANTLMFMSTELLDCSIKSFCETKKMRQFRLLRSWNKCQITNYTNTMTSDRMEDRPGFHCNLLNFGFSVCCSSGMSLRVHGPKELAQMTIHTENDFYLQKLYSQFTYSTSFLCVRCRAV